MDQVISSLQSATRQDGAREQNEQTILQEVGEFSASTASERNAGDLHSVENFPLRLLIGLLKTDHFDVGPLFNQRLCSPARSWIRRIGGIGYRNRAFPGQSERTFKGRR